MYVNSNSCLFQSVPWKIFRLPRRRQGAPEGFVPGSSVRSLGASNLKANPDVEHRYLCPPGIYQTNIAASNCADEYPHDRIISAWNRISLQVSLTSERIEIQHGIPRDLALVHFKKRDRGRIGRPPSKPYRWPTLRGRPNRVRPCGFLPFPLL